LIFIFKERVFFFELFHFGWVWALTNVGPSVVNFLSFFPKSFDTIDAVIILRLMIKRSFTLGCVVQNVVFSVILSLVDENFAIEFLDFNIPRVV
jgi:hypothetical protein